MIALPLPPARPRPVLFVTLAVAYAAGIFVLSSLPGSALPAHGRVTAWLYNLAHAPLFCGLALCVGCALVVPARAEATALSPRGVLACAVLCFAYALFDEFHQSFVSARSPDAIDLVTDLAGIGAGIVWLRRGLDGSRVRTALRVGAFVAMAALSAWLATRPFDVGVGA